MQRHKARHQGRHVAAPKPGGCRDAQVPAGLQAARTHAGFDNLETSFKYQFVRDASGELAMSASLDVDWGGTGSSSIGADAFTTLTPTLFVGKGFGFLPDSMKFFKPLAVGASLAAGGRRVGVDVTGSPAVTGHCRGCRLSSPRT